MEIKPSTFMNEFPWASVAGKSENESLACSIMATMHANGDTWTPVTYEQYREYKKSTGSAERHFATENEFNAINKWCKSPDTAVLFSPSWEKLVK